jgi:hypothetical protein
MASRSTQVATATKAGLPPAGAPADKPLEKVPRKSLIASMSHKYGIEPEKMMSTLKATAFRQRGKGGGPPPDITNEQMLALLLVSNEYNLNPWTKEIYAFPQDGGIVPVIGIDGWLRLINSQPQLDYMEIEQAEHAPGVVPEWIQCTIKRKDRSRPTIIREYYVECKRDTDPWNKMPRRMLRHKAIKECGRVAFGFAGLYDQDDADYIMNTIDVTPRNTKPATEAPKALPQQSDGPILVTTEQVEEIRTALQKANMDEGDLLDEYKLAALQELEFDVVPDVLAWISNSAA